jgi:hypothetical protein
MRRGEAGLIGPVGHPGAAAGKDRSDGPSHVAFWLRPVSLFGRFGVTSPASLHVRSAFHVSPGRAPSRGWQSCRRCPRSFTPWVTPQHVRVGAPKHRRVRPGSPDRHSYLDPCNILPSGVLEGRECFWSRSSPSASLASRDILFPRLASGRNGAECGPSRPFFRTTRTGPEAHFGPFSVSLRPSSLTQPNHARLVRMSEPRNFNGLEEARRDAGLKELRSGGVNWDQNEAVCGVGPSGRTAVRQRV